MNGVGTPWIPATDVEQGLLEARSRGDWSAYFDVLAGTHVFLADGRREVDAGYGESSVGAEWWNPAIGQWCLTVVTEGMLPVPSAEVVFHSPHLHQLGEWLALEGWWLAVNPGTPCEGYFPPNPQLWRTHMDRVKTPDQTKRLRAIRTGPTHGPVAQGLACGVQLCINNGFPWNMVNWHGAGYRGERKSLKEWWGIEDRAGWLAQQEALLSPEVSNSYWEFVLMVRQGVARASGRPMVDAMTWRSATQQVLQAEGKSNKDIKKADGIIGKILRYEARFRADGILAEDQCVSSVRAWYLGRASNMARWGLGARFCEMGETEQRLVRTAELSRAAYDSWADFGLGFILGRCLHFDKERFGSWFTEMVDVYRTLMSDPGSPWLNIPWYGDRPGDVPGMMAAGH
ncbi:DUF1266 domain-containing protein [Streptomyces sp. NPDC048650]|uniref:DUF1266 domain-containing protein n=1 Tax=unclassified Streptomyces TaxID=2593676 RepID=UPI003721ED18